MARPVGQHHIMTIDNKEFIKILTGTTRGIMRLDHDNAGQKITKNT